MFVLLWRRARERERHVSARLRGEETEGNSVTTAPNALKSLTLLPLCVIWLTICLVIFALSFWLVVVYLRRTVPERRLVVREKKVVSLGPESPSQKERHHPRGGPGTPSPSPSLPLSLSRCTSGKLPLPPVRTGSLRTHHRVRRTLPCLFTSRMNSIIFGPLRSVPNCHHRLRPPPPRLAYQPPVP